MLRHVLRWAALTWLCVAIPLARAQDEPAPLQPQTAGAPAPEPELHARVKPWMLAVTPYLWLTGVAVDTEERSLNADVEDLTKLLNAALMLNVAAQYEDFGLTADYIWVKLSTTSQIRNSSARLDFTEHILDLRGSYRVLDTREREAPNEPGAQLFVDMGARYWKLDSELALDIPPLLPNGMGVDDTFASSPSWWDWIVGGHVFTTVTDRVRFALTVNVGGFNIGDSSKFTWEITSTAIFRIWSVLHLDVGYRALQTTRDGTGRLPTTKITMSGLVLGLTAMF